TPWPGARHRSSPGSRTAHQPCSLLLGRGVVSGPRGSRTGPRVRQNTGGSLMKVTAVTPLIVDPGYGKNWLFVKVETSDGLHGWGECYSQADRDQSIIAHVRQLGRYLLGRDASHIRHFTHLPTTTSRASVAPWISGAR